MLTKKFNKNLILNKNVAYNYKRVFTTKILEPLFFSKFLTKYIKKRKDFNKNKQFILV